MAPLIENEPGPNLLPERGEAYFFKDLFSEVASDRFFNALMQETAWQQEPITIFGKSIMQPRLTAWYGETGKAYTYSGITMQPKPWTKTLLEIKERVESVAGVNFTSALLNQYRNGSDSMGWHRDNEKELGPNPVIASVSFGAARVFKFRKYKSTGDAVPLVLTHGSLLVMRGETQNFWEHQVPKTSKDTGVRINITFRVIE